MSHFRTLLQLFEVIKENPTIWDKMCQKILIKPMKLCTPWRNFSCVDHEHHHHPCTPGAANEDGIFKVKIIAKFMRKSKAPLSTLTEPFSLQSQMVCMNGENWSWVRKEEVKWGINIWNCFSVSWSLSLLQGFYNFRQTNNISRTFQGQTTVFKEPTKIYSINWHSLTPLWTAYWLKHLMEPFTIFTSSAMADHIILYYVPQQHFTKINVNSHWVCKETEIEFCSCTKMFWQYPWVLQVFAQGMSQNFLGEII